MARKRMFDLEIVDTDLFLEMPQSTQNLYFHLGMRADDDGFVSNPRKIIKVIGANEDDLKLLALKKFIFPFENGICVIRHWKINNYLRQDRYKETLYKEEKRLLTEEENGSYALKDNGCNNLVYQNTTIGLHSIDKSSIDKISIGNRFTPPTVLEVENYCKERNNGVNAQRFCDFYESKGWMVGSNKMKDWKSAVRTWEKPNTQPTWLNKTIEAEIATEEEQANFEKLLGGFK